jgi:hypothetical protein
MKTAPALILLAAIAAAQPASDPLQLAIYNQEVKGDLDGAIRVYRQILDAGAPMRLYAAQAQYRLGTCLERKGDVKGAAAAFEAVIHNYPDQRELVALARANLPVADRLLPAPWSEPEIAEYAWKIAGAEDAWSVSRIGSAANRKLLHIQMDSYAPYPSFTIIDVDRDTMRPIEATYRKPVAERALTPGPLQKMHLAAAVFKGDYAYGELLYLLRRVPLGTGFNMAVRLVTPPDGQVTAWGVRVTGMEVVTTPAGRFDCYRVNLSPVSNPPPPPYSSAGIDWPASPNGETLWYDVNGVRALVKIQSGTATGELAALRSGKQFGTVSYRDPQVGYSFTVPAGWMFHSRPATTPPGTSVDLLDPESHDWIIIAAKPKKTAPDKIVEELQQGAEVFARDRRSNLNPILTMSHKVAGHEALTWVGESPNGRKTETIWVQSESTRASITIRSDKATFERLRQRFQPILDSFRMP